MSHPDATLPLPILYSSVRSPHCLKVSMVLHEKSVAFDRVEVDLTRKEQRTPAYLAINPLGQVPVYADDRGIHIDSLVIMKVLDARHPVPRLFPQDAEDSARVDAWIERSSGAMRDVSHYLYWQLIEPPAEGTDADEVARLKGAGELEIAAVERALAASGSGWLLTHMSAADIAVFAWLSGYDRFDLPADAGRYPHTSSWLARLRTRPSYTMSVGAVGRPFAGAGASGLGDRPV